MSGVSASSTEVWPVRVGWALTVLSGLAMAGSASMKLSHSPDVVSMFVGKFGFSENALLPLAILEIAVTLLYLFPRTAVLGAILLTGYLGGAVATHVRVNDVFIPPLMIGIIAWGGVFLRHPRLRALLPVVNNLKS